MAINRVWCALFGVNHARMDSLNGPSSPPDQEYQRWTANAHLPLGHAIRICVSEQVRTDGRRVLQCGEALPRGATYRLEKVLEHAKGLLAPLWQ